VPWGRRNCWTQRTSPARSGRWLGERADWNRMAAFYQTEPDGERGWKFQPGKWFTWPSRLSVGRNWRKRFSMPAAATAWCEQRAPMMHRRRVSGDCADAMQQVEDNLAALRI